MVMQRDKGNTLWGWTAAGEKVTVTVEGRKTSTKAGADGKWMVKVGPPPVGGPYTINIDSPTQHAALEDVLVGDVWICSGQSNMEMGIGGVFNAEREIADADRPKIRLFTVARNIPTSPAQTLAGSWSVCTPQTVSTGGWGGFSAVGYFFGRELQTRLNIPIGLVSSNWGGTIAESWTSAPGLKAFPEFQPALKAVAESAGTTPEQRLGQWATSYDRGTSESWQNPSFDDGRWPTVAKPTFEEAGLGAFDGVVWFRTTFDLPADFNAGQASEIQFGIVDDLDTTWINGVRVGESYGFSNARAYQVPAGVLKPGKNVLSMRIIDTGGPGGLNTPEKIAVVQGPSNTPLGSGVWRWARGTDLREHPMPTMFAGDPNIPSLLYNGMIAPIVPLAIKGAIWYQGESNAGRAAQYQRLLPAMISDWRRAFDQGDFPFLIVQLANFQIRHPEPVEDAWAELREAQAIVARKVKNSGLAVTIDIGERNDIHPRNKQDVGRRLALQALNIAYGVMLEHSGPTFKSMKREGAAIRVRFDFARGLHSKGELRGFQVAGSDGKFQWAEAKVDGDSVLISSPNVPVPMKVRYAWDTDPEAPLYNAAELPAVPFRASF